MNLRDGHWNLPLVQRLCRLASVLKLNQSEAETLHRLTAAPAQSFSLQAFSEEWAAQYQLEAVCITLGPQGCFIYQNGSGHTAPAYPASVADTVGAGDAFAAAFLHGYHRGWPPVKTARFANALGSIVASRPGATPSWTVEECLALIDARD
jgi:fructokinase